MKYTTYLLSAAALFVLGGCQNEERFSSEDALQEVILEVEIAQPASSRTQPHLDGAEGDRFTAGDRIEFVSPTAAVYECVEQGWKKASGALYWAVGDTHFQCFYPEGNGASFDAFTVPQDQSDATKLAAADYMKGEMTVSRPANNSLSMELNRQMARVVVRVEPVVDPALADHVLSGLKILSHQTLSNDAGAHYITPFEQTDAENRKTYTALVSTVYDESKPFITMTDETAGSQLNSNFTPHLEAGKTYFYSINVGNPVLSLNLLQEDYTEGGEFSGGGSVVMSPETHTAVIDGTYPAGRARELMITLGNQGYLYFILTGNVSRDLFFNLFWFNTGDPLDGKPITIDCSRVSFNKESTSGFLECPKATKKFVMPANATSVWRGFFNECYNSIEVVFSGHETRFEDRAFGQTLLKDGRFVVPESVEVIEQKCFYGAQNTEYVFSKNIKEVGLDCLNQCWPMTKLTVLFPASNSMDKVSPYWADEYRKVPMELNNPATLYLHQSWKNAPETHKPVLNAEGKWVFCNILFDTLVWVDDNGTPIESEHPIV